MMNVTGCQVFFKSFENFRPFLKTRSGFLTPACNIKTKIEDRLGLPPKPKRPLNPFLKFLASTRETLKTTEPYLQAPELVKKSSDLWKKLDPSIKSSLENQYKSEMEGYMKQKNKYDASLTPEQKAEIEIATKMHKAEKQKKKERLEKRSRIKELGKPKKPLAAFFIYMEVQAQKAGGGRSSEFTKEMSQKWREMSEKDKEGYVKEYEKQKKTYEEKIQNWEKKMMDMGNIDLIRQKTLAESEGKDSKKLAKKSEN